MDRIEEFSEFRAEIHFFWPKALRIVDTPSTLLDGIKEPLTTG